MKLNVACDLFIASCKAQNYTEKTIQNYESFLSRFVKCVGNIDLAQLTYEVVSDYSVMLYERNISKATHGTYIRHVKAFIHWLEEMEYLDLKISKKIKVPKTPKKNVHIYEDEEIKRIFSAIQIKPEWLRLRNCLIVTLMLDSGLRQKEVSLINMSDISFKENFLIVHGKGNKERTVPLGNLSMSYLSKYLKKCPYSTNKLMVDRTGKPITCNTIKLMISKLSKELPFEFSSHKLRHNYATNYCLDQYEQFGQVDIYKLMILLGHEDTLTTRRYLHMASQLIASKSSISHLDKILL